MRSIKIKNIGKQPIGAKRVNVYKDGVLIAKCESHTHAANLLKTSKSTISRHLNTGEPFLEEGYIIWSFFRDPNLEKPKNPDEMTPEQDLPVAMFDREGDIMLAEFKSVTQCAHALQRPVKTVFSWLKGARCTDPDCYYKYVHECTQKELSKRFTL